MIITAASAGYFAIKVTKEMSATTRQVVFSGRTVFVWIVALCVKWQAFEYRLEPRQVYFCNLLPSGTL
jgi:uncharacterized membrane protein YdbT with pleckstrin-like domain